MKILVTGGNGFIGSNFIRYFLKKKIVKKIINIDKNSYESISDNFLNFKSKKYFKIKDNLSSSKKIEKIILNHKIDIILHMAAESHVDRSIKDPHKYIMSNVIPTLNILRACVSTRNKRSVRLIYFSTDEVFGSNHKSPPFKLTSQLNPSSPYSASKAAAGLLVSSWRKTYNIDASIVYCCNNYGPYQNPEKLIPASIYRIMNSLPILIYGNGKQIRTWIYVEDTIRAIDKIINVRENINRDYIIGSNRDYTNLTIIRKLISIVNDHSNIGNAKDLIQFTQDRPGHDLAYKLSKDKVLEKLGFKILFDLDRGLKKTVKWYMENPKFIEKNKYKSFIKNLRKVGFK